MLRRTLLCSWRSSAADGFEEASACELRRAVRGLQRYADERQRRADVHDRAAVARLHVRQCGHRAPYLAEERHLDRPLEVGWLHLAQSARTPSSWHCSPRRRSLRVRPRSVSPLRGPDQSPRCPVDSANPRRPAFWTSLTTPSSPTSPRANSATSKPRRANSRAVARPTPADAPVTTAIRFMDTPPASERAGSARGRPTGSTFPKARPSCHRSERHDDLGRSRHTRPSKSAVEEVHDRSAMSGRDGVGAKAVIVPLGQCRDTEQSANQQQPTVWSGSRGDRRAAGETPAGRLPRPCGPIASQRAPFIGERRTGRPRHG